VGKAKAKAKFSAAGSMLGYLSQCRCALLLLLQKAAVLPNPQMSVERFDDVSFDLKGEPREAVQTKHHQGVPKSLSDSSVDLWKTLRVWCEGVRDGTFKVPGTLFSLITTQPAPAGGAAILLRQERRDPGQATMLLLAAASKTANREIKDACAVFNKLPAKKRTSLIEAVYVHDNAPGITQVWEKLSQAVHYAAHRDHREAFLEHLEGWWLRRVIRHLSASKNPPIRGAELEDEIARIQDGFREGTLPIDRPLPDPPQPPDPAADTRQFVERLRRVGVRSPRLRNAILDFYREQGRLVKTDGEGDSDGVFDRLVEAVRSHLDPAAA